MHEVLLQSIVEKLQAIEMLLKQDNAGKNEQSITNSTLFSMTIFNNKRKQSNSITSEKIDMFF